MNLHCMYLIFQIFLDRFNLCLILGSRIKTSLDFGLVKLDISSVRSSDVGIYTCKAVNLNGEATSTTSIKVQGKVLIVYFQERNGGHLSFYS